ncbi:MAG: malonyl-CoA decarboxylase [Betaproteobacteria bacterium]|nr:malonyl-CoA decarboxylase [Betaproteobacteria bacterium]
METPAFLRRLFGRDAHGSAAAALALCRALLSERGEASGATLAREAVRAIEALDDAERERFFDALAGEFSPAPSAVTRAAQAYQADPGPRTLARLQRTVEPVRQELYRRLNMAPGGMAALVAMRTRLLAGLSGHPQWRAADDDLLHLFHSWFNRGFLRLERIDWRTPANILEKLIDYEAVHAISGWDDLRRRLQADRRCFAFFHPALPDEPLIFIEVALTRALAERVEPLLEPGAPIEDAERATHAMFYSITNCQDGLRGISFGNFLIKQVAEDLRSQLPKLKTFATLSPVPGFAAWLSALRKRGELQLPALEQPDWHDAEDRDALQKDLSALCAHYLLHARRGEEPLDPVARFHLGNGAMLERVNWLADLSQAGLARSLGMMVNYVYRLEDVEKNHEAYVKAHRVIASRSVEKLARECPLAQSEAAG